MAQNEHEAHRGRLVQANFFCIPIFFFNCLLLKVAISLTQGLAGWTVTSWEKSEHLEQLEQKALGEDLDWRLIVAM